LRSHSKHWLECSKISLRRELHLYSEQQLRGRHHRGERLMSLKIFADTY
jgi:hypothetical protein